jgi:beta-lactamase superfamily II metal-dependent hydrolase
LGAAPELSEGRLGPVVGLNLLADELAIFILNVGDGDAIVIRFPEEGGRTTLGVIDSFKGDKSVALIQALKPPAPAPTPRIRFVCATHPHFDHIAGLRKVLTTFDAQVDEFWDSGFRFTSTTYRGLIEEVERQGKASGLRLVRPTSGVEFFHAGALITILSPSIALRNRYDTYGVDLNNASIVTKIAYPAPRPSLDYPKAGEPPPAAPLAAPKYRTVIFGGDAQTDAWGRVLDEYPHLEPDERLWARAIGAKNGRTPLRCDLFKVSHHCSKRGINLELIERLGDRGGGFPSKGPYYLVSSCASGADSGYGFPHDVSQSLMREVTNPQAQAGGIHPTDDELGIHYTAQLLAPPGVGPAGSLAYVIGADGSGRLYRLGDAVENKVSLANARLVKRHPVN